MLTTAPHLQKRSPSPTTVQYQVSNAPLRQSLAARALFATAVLLRATAVLLALALLAVKYACSLETQTCSHEALVPLAQVSDVHVEAMLTGDAEEKLLVMRTLGVQTSTSSGSYLGTATTRFIPTSQIQDIFIHEAFIGFEVRYYLAIIVDGEDEVTVVFPNLLPKLPIVEEVWRGTRSCLFESKPRPTKDPR